jgi:LacI family transcriptional regulator
MTRLIKNGSHGAAYERTPRGTVSGGQSDSHEGTNHENNSQSITQHETTLQASQPPAPPLHEEQLPLVRSSEAKVTLQMIADYLSVSTATVSLALRNSPLIAERTRELVRKTADELGYTHNRGAAALRTAQTNLIAVALQDFSHPYFSSILMALERTAGTFQKSILLGSSGDQLSRQDNILGLLREHRPEGLIWCPAQGTGIEVVHSLQRARLPVVQVSREVPGSGFDFIGVDNIRGFEMALRHVVELGHTRIAFIGGQENTTKGMERLRGYKQALARFEMQIDPRLIYLGPGTRDTGRIGLDHMLTVPDAPTAVICYNDEVALGVIHRAGEKNLEIGRHLSVIGCNDTADIVSGYPALTTLQTHPDDMGTQAVQMLVKRINTPALPTQRVLLEPKLIARASTGLKRSV